MSLPPMLANIPFTSPESAFAPRVEFVIGAPQSVEGMARKIHGKTACRTVRGELPLITPRRVAPRVGQEWECLFTTTAIAPYPDLPMWVIVSTRPMADPIDFTPFGMPGAWLLVNPDMIVAVPDGEEPSMLTRTPGTGRAMLRWTPDPGMEGQRVFLQLLVSWPGQTPSGFVSSHGMEILVGSAELP